MPYRRYREKEGDPVTVLIACKGTGGMTPGAIARNLKNGIRPLLARRGTPHRNGLGRYRWVVERSLSWLHQYRKPKSKKERGTLTHMALMLLVASLIYAMRLGR